MANMRSVTIAGLGQAPLVAVTIGAIGPETMPATSWVVLAQKAKVAVLSAVVLCQLLSRVMRPVQGASWRLAAAGAGGTGWTQLHVQARKPRLLAPATGASLGGVGGIAVLAFIFIFRGECV